MTAPVRLGLRANAGQFGLLIALNALVGGMVGLERSVLPLIGKQDFGGVEHRAQVATLKRLGPRREQALVLIQSPRKPCRHVPGRNLVAVLYMENIGGRGNLGGPGGPGERPAKLAPSLADSRRDRVDSYFSPGS